jgi:hypothetical protein
VQPEDILPTLAEISVTVAGFTAVLVAFRPASAGQWSKAELVRVRAALILPGHVLVLSLLPFGLAGFTQAPAVVWGLPLLVFGIVGFALLARTISEVLRGDFQLTSRPVGTLLITVSVVINIVALLSGAGLLFPYSPGLLVLALAWTLVSTAVTLVLMLVFWRRSSAA